MRSNSLIRLTVPFGAALAATLFAIVHAPAEVWEYGADGQILSVNGSAAAQHWPDRAVGSEPGDAAALGAARARYRTMAEAVALQHAGSDGVRLAGLDALTFAEVFCALIEQESRFDPRAVSAKGAQGLGQLMPETAALLEVSDPFDPEANLHGAARYFTEQLANFRDVDLALAAYNAGPHRIVEHGGIPPFRETRDYVARITEAAGLVMSSRGPVATRDALAPLPSNRKASVWEF